MSQTWDSDLLLGRLIRAGMRRDHALRTVTEFSGHLTDLEQEERAGGKDEAGAREAACRRMGDPKEVVRQITRSYRRRFFIGRHPIVFFVIAPLFVSLLCKMLILMAMAFPIYAGWREPFVSWLRIWSDSLSIVVNVAAPMVLVWAFLRAARRRAVGFAWRFVAAIGVAVACQVAWVHIWIEPEGSHGRLMIGHRGIGLLDVFYVAVTLAVACLSAGVFGRKLTRRRVPREQIPVT